MVVGPFACGTIDCLSIISVVLIW